MTDIAWTGATLLFPAVMTKLRGVEAMFFRSLGSLPTGSDPVGLRYGRAHSRAIIYYIVSPGTGS